MHFPALPDGYINPHSFHCFPMTDNNQMQLSKHCHVATSYLLAIIASKHVYPVSQDASSLRHGLHLLTTPDELPVHRKADRSAGFSGSVTKHVLHFDFPGN